MTCVLELDNNSVLNSKVTRESRIVRIARGSGRSIRVRQAHTLFSSNHSIFFLSLKEVNELLEQFKHFDKMMKKMKQLKIPKNGQLNQRNISQVSNIIPPHIMKQMGGLGAVQNMMKSLGNMGDIGSLAKKMMGNE